MKPAILLLLLSFAFPVAWPAEPVPATPAATAADWLEQPGAAAQAAAKQAGDTAATSPEVSSWLTKALGWAAGAAGLAIAIGKFLPGVGGAVANILGPIYDLAVSRQVRDAEKRRDALSAGMETTMRLIEKLPPDTAIAVLKNKLSTRLPGPARDAVIAWLDANEDYQATTETIEKKEATTRLMEHG